MADLSFNTVQGTPPQTGMSLSDILNIARGAQAYQQAQQINPLLLQQQQLATERAAATQAPAISQAQSQAGTAAQQLEQQKLLTGQNYASQVGSTYAALLADDAFNPAKPDSAAMVKKLQAAHSFLTEDLGVPESPSKMTDKLIEMAKTDPQQAIQTIRNGLRGMSGIGTQAQQLNASPLYANQATPQGIRATPMNVSPYQQGTQPTAPSYTPAIAPESANQIVIDPATGQPRIVSRTAAGQIQPGTGQTVFPATAETATSYQGLLNHRDQAQQAAMQVPQVQDSLSQIKGLATQIAQGKPGQLEAALARQIGYVAGGDAATNNQKLGHYLALVSGQLANSMGLNSSDSARAQADQIAGKADWTPEAIKSTAETLQAYNTGVGLYSRGLSAAANQLDPRTGQAPIRQYRDAWAQNFNVDAMRLYNARLEGGLQGKMDYDQTIKEMGGKNSPQFKRALQSLGNLKQLSNGQIVATPLPAPGQ